MLSISLNTPTSLAWENLASSGKVGLFSSGASARHKKTCAPAPALEHWRDIMQLAVSSRAALPNYASAGIKYVVSLTDPGSEGEPLAIPESSVKTLQLRFHDLDDIEIKAKKYRRYKGPYDDHVKEIIQFFREIEQSEDPNDPNCSILVHCEAGISRSAAAAIIGLTVLGYSHEQAFGFIMEANPHSLPNRRMLRIADTFLNTRLCEVGEAHRKSQFALAGYEDPVEELDRENQTTVRARVDRILHESTSILHEFGVRFRKLPRIFHKKNAP